MTTVINAKKNKTMYFVHWIITLALMFLIPQLPLWGVTTQYGMQILGIFIGLMWGWIFIDFLTPSLVAILVLLIFVDGIGWADITAQGLGNQNVFTMVVIMALAQYFEDSGLNRYLAYWFVSRKFNIGRPWIFSGIIIAAGWFFSAFAQQIPAMLLLWGIVYTIANEVGMPNRHKWITYMCVGICLSASYGGLAVPWQFMGLMFINSFTTATSIPVTFVEYVPLMTAFSALTIAVYVLVGKFILCIDVTAITNKDDRYAEMRNAKMNPKQRKAGIVMLIFAIMLLVPSFLPTTWPIVAQLYLLSTNGAIVIALLVVAFFRNKETGSSEYDMNKLFFKSTQWNVIIMCSTCFPLLNMLESDQSGVITSLVNLITPVLNNLSPLTCIIICTIVLGLMTQAFHNLMLGLIFIPIGAEIMIQIGGSPLAFMMAIGAALLTSNLTPAASTQSALLFGQQEDHYNKNDLLLYAAVSCIVGIGTACIFLAPIASILV